MRDIQERLRMILEGTILTEADDKYDMTTDDDTPATDDTSADTGDASTGDVSATTSDDVDPDDATESGVPDDGSSSDDADTGDDSTGDGSDSADGAEASDDTDGDGEEDGETSEEDTTTPGEVLPIDDISRKLLAYRNFRKYRELRDSVSDMMTNLSAMPTMSDAARQIVKTCTEKAGELLNKLTDYIQFRYANTSYEINYQNFMQFVYEKRLIEQILNSIPPK